MSKILCLTDGFTLGGAERQLIGLAHFLMEKGYSVDLACYYEKNFYKDLISQYGLNCITLKPKGRFGKFLEVKRLINEGSYNYVIAYKDGPTTMVSILKLFGLKAKVIVSERNTTQALSIRERLKFWCYRFADFIVPNSYSQENFIVSNYPSYRDKTVTITNFTDTDSFVPSGSQLERNTIEVIIAGRIAEQKNIMRFLDVVKFLKDRGTPYHFKWFGNVSAGEQEYESDVKQKWHQLGLEDMFEFLSATNNIKREYQECDAFCLPSLYEGYPNVVCEAMSCGKPILCSRICDNPYIVEEGVNGFMFDPTDVNDIFDTLVRFSELTIDERYAMGFTSREIAVKKFSEESFVNKYIQLIDA